MKFLFSTYAFVLIHLCSFSQALDTNPEEGKGTYKNRVFFNLERYWDSDKVCNNPHKGWFIHYYDNGLRRYGNRLAPMIPLRAFQA